MHLARRSASRAGRSGSSRRRSRVELITRRSRRGRRPPRRRGAAARPASRPAPNQPRAIASSRVSTVGPVPEHLAPGRGHVVDRAAAAVEVPEPRLAAEQHHAVAQLGCSSTSIAALAAGSRPCRGRRPRPAASSAGSASRSCSASASIIASCWQPLRARRRRTGGRSSRGRRRRRRSATAARAAPATAPAIRSPMRSAPTYVGSALRRDGQPGAVELALVDRR